MSIAHPDPAIPLSGTASFARTPTPLLQQVATGIGPALKRWTASEYHQLIAAGMISDGAPIELIDGQLVGKERSEAGDAPMSHGQRHIAAVRRLQRMNARLADAGCFMQTQLPLAISEDHEPEPDGCLLRGVEDDYENRMATPFDTLLVIEIADTSLSYDRGTKQQIYATAAIPIYWIVNLRNNTIEVYEQPDSQVGEYRLRRDFQPGQSVELMLPAADPLAIDVASILG